MQTLIVYYSRTGHTKKVAESLAKELQCDVEEIVDTVNRSGPLGFLNSGRQASSKALTKLQPVTKDPSKYDLVIIGTPIWAKNMSSPVRTYISENHAKFHNIAIFCTAGDRCEDSTFKDMGDLSGKKPKATLAVYAAEIKKDSYADKVKKFVAEVKT